MAVDLTKLDKKSWIWKAEKVMNILKETPRISFTNLSKQTGIPLNTVREMLQRIEKIYVLKGEWKDETDNVQKKN